MNFKQILAAMALIIGMGMQANETAQFTIIPEAAKGTVTVTTKSARPEWDLRVNGSTYASVQFIPESVSTIAELVPSQEAGRYSVNVYNNGTKTFIATIFVTTVNGQAQFNIIPESVHGNVKISSHSNEAGIWSVDVYDASGNKNYFGSFVVKAAFGRDNGELKAVHGDSVNGAERYSLDLYSARDNSKQFFATVLAQ